MSSNVITVRHNDHDFDLELPPWAWLTKAYIEVSGQEQQLDDLKERLIIVLTDMIIQDYVDILADYEETPVLACKSLVEILSHHMSQHPVVARRLGHLIPFPDSQGHM
eukprot:4610880-Amphidinium_carterae.1